MNFEHVLLIKHAKLYKPLTRYWLIVRLSEFVLDVCLLKEETQENVFFALYALAYQYNIYIL